MLLGLDSKAWVSEKFASSLTKRKMSGLGPLHFTGKVDRQEEMFMLNAQKEQAVMKTLLQYRDPATYNMMYGYRRVRDVYDPPTRGQSGKNVVLPFYDR